MGDFNITASELTELYTKYNPAAKNLYTVQIYATNEETTAIEDVNDYLKFHATSVTFNGETFDLERNPITRKFQVRKDAYKWSDELIINWREADDWRVRKYHEKWISLFYDRKKDCYKSNDITTQQTKNNLYRTFIITLPESKSSSGFNSIDKKLHRIKFKSVLPKNVGNLNLSWSSAPSFVEHSLSYYVEDWEWVADNELGTN